MLRLRARLPSENSVGKAQARDCGGRAVNVVGRQEHDGLRGHRNRYSAAFRPDSPLRGLKVFELVRNHRHAARHDVERRAGQAKRRVVVVGKTIHRLLGPFPVVGLANSTLLAGTTSENSSPA